MSRPFSPRDVFRLRHLQERGTSLEIEDAVLVGQSPLRQAMAACWPLGAGTTDTLLAAPLEAGTEGGVIQSRRRDGRPEADLTFIAPAHAQANSAALAWGRLIGDACLWLGRLGVARVFAAITEDDQVALQVFRHAGFSAYTTDVVFSRPSGETPPAPEDLTVRAFGPDGTLAVQQLVHECLPEAVRRTFPDLGGDWPVYPLGGHAPGAAAERLWLDGDGSVLGAWRVIGGLCANWLKVATRPGTEAGPLVRRALSDLAADQRFRPLPVFASARGYESELNLALRENGFEPHLRRFRLVKHTAIRVMAPAWHTNAVAEAGLDPAAPSSIRIAASPRTGETSVDTPATR